MTNAPRLPSSSCSFLDIAHAAWRSTRYMPIRFTPSVISNGIGLAGPSLPIVRSAQPTPAQFTQKRISPPSASTAPSTAAFTLSSSWTSVSKNGSPASFFRGVWVPRGAVAPLARLSLRSWAVAAPSPEAPPTTRAPSPSIFMRRDSTKRCTFPPDGGFVRSRGGAAPQLQAPGVPVGPAAGATCRLGGRRPDDLRTDLRLLPGALEDRLHRAADRRGGRRLRRRLGAPQSRRGSAPRLHRRRV